MIPHVLQEQNGLYKINLKFGEQLINSFKEKEARLTPAEREEFIRIWNKMAAPEPVEPDPLPWNFEQGTDGEWIIVNNLGDRVASDVELTPTNARLIVEAVNQHANLVKLRAAATGLVRQIDAYGLTGTDSSYDAGLNLAKKAYFLPIVKEALRACQKAAA